jgi:spore germination cell wall hydrolase CwlJ-like protein
MIAEALLCLSLNLYHEAKNQSFAGMVAVGNVVMNRVASPKFPNTVCGVIKQGGERRRHRCQFSWYCDGKPDKPYNKLLYDRSEEIARLILNGAINDITDGALYYHATYVSPRWAKKFKRTVRIDDHIFYKPK